MNLNYVLNSPVDLNTTKEAKTQQTSEMLNLLYKTVRPELVGNEKVEYKGEADRIQLFLRLKILLNSIKKLNLCLKKKEFMG